MEAAYGLRKATNASDPLSQEFAHDLALDIG